MRGRAARVALPALVVVGLVAIVAVASRGSTPGGSDATRPPSETLFDVLFSIGLVGVVIGGVLLLYGLSQRRAIAQEMATRKYRRTGILAFLLFFALFTGVTAWRMNEWTRPEQPDEAEPDPGGTGLPGPTLPPEAEASYEPTVSWVTLTLVAALIVGAIVAFVVSERRSRRGRTPGPGVLAEQLAAVFDDTLDDLRAEADPRRAIIATYARAERVLGANGIARRPSETSGEYLERVLRDLELEGAAIGRLTDLFTRAKFSHHDVDTTMKEEAIGALEDVRDELRTRVRDPGVASEHARAPVGASS